MRLRDVLAILFGVAIVGLLAYLGWAWFIAETEPDVAPEEADAADALATAEAYLAAWEAGDLGAMRELLRAVPEDFDETHRQLDAALSPTSFSLETGELTEEEDGRAIVDVAVQLTPAAAPRPIEWDTTLRLTRIRSEWTVEWSLSTVHPELRPTWVFATNTAEVPRRPILARDGVELATDDARIIGFVPGAVDDPEDVIDAFERVLPGSGAAAKREFDRGELVDDWFYPVVTVSRPRAEAAWVRLRTTSGIIEPRTPPEGERRTLLDLGFARHLVGIVAEATAEQLEELEEQGIDAPVGTRVPQFGLEAVLDDQLTGSELFQVGLREASGGELAVVIDEVQANPSSAVETTLDTTVQRAVENALLDFDETAAIVVVDGSDGAIVASASRPLTGFDRARAGRYPPGSTFKTVTLEAALATGMDLDDEVSCPADTVVGGLAVTNAGDLALGTTTLGAAFAASCNTTFARLAGDLGGEALAEAAERFGFNTEPSLPLDAFGGSFPEPGDTAEVAAAGFGQARVEASPLHLAAMAAALVEGVWHPPYLLLDDGPGAARPLATGAAERLRAAYRQVVTDGTGTAADVDGVEVGGKTGTAEHVDGDDHAWFTGTVDGLGFAVLVENGGSGSAVAAPLAGRFVAELTRLRAGDIDPTDPEAARPGGTGESQEETRNDAESGD